MKRTMGHSVHVVWFVSVMMSCVCGLGVFAANGVPAKAKIPVILDTDIGGDIDDTWALVMLLKTR